MKGKVNTGGIKTQNNHGGGEEYLWKAMFMGDILQ